MSNAAQRAEDRWLISDTLSKYVWGYDEGDFALLGDAFTEDAVACGKVANTDIGWGTDEWSQGDRKGAFIHTSDSN
jgi:hypothetical protein